MAKSGADRAGLDFAIKTSLEHVGFVPMGRKPEDNADSLRLEVQSLTDFRCSNKIEVLNGLASRIEGAASTMVCLLCCACFLIALVSGRRSS